MRMSEQCLLVATVHEANQPSVVQVLKIAACDGSFSPMSNACDLLAPLQRWITYTRWEVLQINRDLHEHRQEVLTTQKIQQQQLDTVQAQLREGEQRLLEVIEAAAELFQKQCRNHDLSETAALSQSLKAQTQTPEESMVEEIPATQPYR